jgi:DNA repair protein RecO (recombination protein O)
MYHTYHTDALVLSSSPWAEADRLVTLFTKELGLVRAVARSVRQERSKMRYSIQDFAFASVSLVRGKDVWRIVGVRFHTHFYFALKDDTAKVALVARVFSLITRLVAGEEQNWLLFQVLIDMLHFLEDESLSDIECRSVEEVFALRILFILGYVGHDPVYSAYVSANSISRDVLRLSVHSRHAIVRAINEALSASQL